MRQADEERLKEQIEAGEMPPEAFSDLPLPRLSYVSDDPGDFLYNAQPIPSLVPLQTNNDPHRFSRRYVVYLNGHTPET